MVPSGGEKKGGGGEVELVDRTFPSFVKNNLKTPVPRKKKGQKKGPIRPGQIKKTNAVSGIEVLKRGSGRKKGKKSTA